MKTFLLLSLAFLTTTASRADWNRFRGPNGQGKAEGKLPDTWSDKEHMVWKAALPGPGSSSPIVVGDKVFVTCWTGYADGSGGQMSQLKRHLICLKKSDGTVLWNATLPSTAQEDDANGMLMEHGYASSTPVSDGERVYVFYGKSGALAYDMSGKQLWQVPLGTGSNGKRWGSAASPVLFGNTVIITAYDEGGAMVALDKATGKEVWKAPAQGLELAFSTPIIAEHEGTTDLLTAVPGEVWALNPESGKLRWFVTCPMSGNISTGLTLADGMLFATGGFPTQGTSAFRLASGKGDVTSANKAWHVNDASYIPTPIHHNGHLYVINDNGFALCLDAKTGDQVYRERVLQSPGGGGGGGGPGGPGGGRRGGGKPFYASPVLCNGKLYCPSRKSGVFVIPAEPTFKVLATNIIESDTSQFNGSPAVDANRLYLRSDKALYCIGE